MIPWRFKLWSSQILVRVSKTVLEYVFPTYEVPESHFSKQSKKIRCFWQRQNWSRFCDTNIRIIYRPYWDPSSVEEISTSGVEFFHSIVDHIWNMWDWWRALKSIRIVHDKHIWYPALIESIQILDFQSCGKSPQRSPSFVEISTTPGERCGTVGRVFHTDVESKNFSKKSKYRKSEHWSCASTTGLEVSAVGFAPTPPIFGGRSCTPVGDRDRILQPRHFGELESHDIFMSDKIRAGYT